MRVAVMQPYLLPYLGYFQLIHAVDRFVIYDDAQYIKGGWINRNRILIKGRPHYFTLPVVRASHRRPINRRTFADPAGQERERLLKTLAQAYSRAPHLRETLALIEAVLGQDDLNVVRFLVAGLRRVCDHIGISTPFATASLFALDKGIKGQERIIAICERLAARTYVNPVGGVQLYDRERFAAAGIDLRLLEMDDIRYRQFGDDFVPDLSIVDVLMFNDRETVRELLRGYLLR